MTRSIGFPALMNTWEGNSIGLADAAGQMV
jgi:hypothetical protein